jgi:hypothetical protein
MCLAQSFYKMIVRPTRCSNEEWLSTVTNEEWLSTVANEEND